MQSFIHLLIQSFIYLFNYLSLFIDLLFIHSFTILVCIHSFIFESGLPRHSGHPSCVCMALPALQRLNWPHFLPQAGQWTYEVTKSNTRTGYLVAFVHGRTLGGSSPLQVEAWINTLVALPQTGLLAIVSAHVHQSYAPLVGADVTATISRPSGSDVTLTLNDDGLSESWCL